MSIPQKPGEPAGAGKEAGQECGDAAPADGQRVVNELIEDTQLDGEPLTASRVRGHSTEPVKGERGIPSVSRERTIHARITSALAIILMVVLGIGFLSWYYTTAFARRSDDASRMKEAAATAASGELRLPPLAQIRQPQQHGKSEPLYVDTSIPNPSVAEVRSSEILVQRGDGVPTQPAFQQTVSAEETAKLRVLNSPVLYRPSTGKSPATNPGTRSEYDSNMPSGPDRAAATGGGGASLGGLLQPTSTPPVQAQLLATRRLLMPKGAFIDCTLETALNSELPGMTTCITATDIFGADGQVILLERGSKLVGETRGETRLGRGRIFVLWTEARTPTGVVVELASPGTDELGRSGLPGYVDTHFWERFGSAILISVIDGAIQAMAAGQNNGSGGSAVVYNAQGSRDVMTEVLRNTINIPPTVVKNQGERIQVLVARNLDFRAVYSLGSPSSR